jgi:hypothetical protein
MFMQPPDVLAQPLAVFHVAIKIPWTALQGRMLGLQRGVFLSEKEILVVQFILGHVVPS